MCSEDFAAKASRTTAVPLATTVSPHLKYRERFFFHFACLIFRCVSFDVAAIAGMSVHAITAKSLRVLK